MQGSKNKSHMACSMHTRRTRANLGSMSQASSGGFDCLVCALRGMLLETELREQPRAMEHTLATHAGYDSGM